METPSDRLDRAIEERRLDLDLSLNEVAQLAKISPATLRAIRRGTTQPTPLTKRRLEDALRWERGSIDAVDAGGDPTPAGDTRFTDEPLRPPTASEIAELREQLRQIQQRLDRIAGPEEHRGTG